ncbi:TRAP transporter small permease subunit [Phaeobacter sp. J2-8]|uniref:TRAP transporter small permease n=1 Tax=Phaeobacter sp. J2-8 TaxID=2931394 RepID=UPI001FD35C49|nr:TRAP transporter small permease subunit [Phaeobacter sp. J2-8]MCJ7874005.1 TRAP transporter small permease [Phaeobacter sp. J2-8]
MKSITAGFSRLTEFVAAMMMAAMFATFIVQIFIRYTARAPGVSDAVPFLSPDNFGWTLEFCLLMWIWLVFWGNAFIVRQRDHVVFDILYQGVNPALRKWFVIISAVAIIIGLLASIGPTWDRFYILRLKRTATLETLFGSDVRMLHIYMIYIAFLLVVPIRYAIRGWRAFRHGAEGDQHPLDALTDENSKDTHKADNT